MTVAVSAGHVHHCLEAATVKRKYCSLSAPMLCKTFSCQNRRIAFGRRRKFGNDVVWTPQAYLHISPRAPNDRDTRFLGCVPYLPGTQRAAACPEGKVLNPSQV
jgi:hypothetical protein